MQYLRNCQYLWLKTIFIVTYWIFFCLRTLTLDVSERIRIHPTIDSISKQYIKVGILYRTLRVSVCGVFSHNTVLCSLSPNVLIVPVNHRSGILLTLTRLPFVKVSHIYKPKEIKTLCLPSLLLWHGSSIDFW